MRFRLEASSQKHLQHPHRPLSACARPTNSTNVQATNVNLWCFKRPLEGVRPTNYHTLTDAYSAAVATAAPSSGGQGNYSPSDNSSSSSASLARTSAGSGTASRSAILPSAAQLWLLLSGLPVSVFLRNPRRSPDKIYPKSAPTVCLPVTEQQRRR